MKKLPDPRWIEKPFIWRGETLRLEVRPYTHPSVRGQMAIQAWDEDDSPYATLTVAVDRYVPVDGCVVIKDYSENSGVLDALTKQNFVQPCGIVRVGYVFGCVCRLLV